MPKPFKTIDEQIQLLQSRKVRIGNIKFAKRILRYENYYFVINGYKDPFINSTIPEDSYKPDTTFFEILSLYSFDRKLREILLPDLLRIEHVVKARIIDVFSERHGNDHRLYLQRASFNISTPENTQRTDLLIDALLRLIRKQEKHHNAIRHYMKKYGFVPLWVLSTVMTFGKTNSFYGCMLPPDKQAVAQSFRLSSAMFKALIDYLAIFRNKCAHGERIYCHAKDQRKPRPIPNLPMHDFLDIAKNKKGYKYGKNDILALLIAMKYFLQPDRYRHLLARIDYALNSKFAKRIHSTSPEGIRNIMGLTGEWKQLATLPLQ